MSLGNGPGVAPCRATTPGESQYAATCRFTAWEKGETAFCPPPRDGGLQPREALTHAMKTPKTVTATKFKTHCLTLLEEVRQTHHGKPVAEISPYTPKSSEQLNSLKGSVLFEGDIISPLEEKWDCEL